MEVPYEIEDEEFIGLQSLKPKHKSSKSQHPNPKTVENSTNNDTTHSINSSFQYSPTMDDNNNTTTTTTIQPFTNGENPQIIEANLSQVQEDETYSEYKEAIKSESAINVAQNGESNGFTSEQNGNGVIEYPTLQESNGDGATTSSSSKTLETNVGLKNVKSLFNGSSNGVNGTPSEAYNAESIVNKTLILNGQNEIIEASGSQEVEIGVDEYDVEKVIHNQESHDLICPYCKLDITKRIILKRRKRKIGELYDGDVNEKSGLASIEPSENPDTQKSKPEEEPSHGEGRSDGSIDAISCFSCFSVFVPKGDGFLRWRFTPKPDVTPPTGDLSVGNRDPADLPPVDKPGNAFPFWILTFCQPYSEKPVPKPDPKPPSTPDDELPPSIGPIEGTILPITPEPPVTPGKDTPSITEPLTPIGPNEEIDSSLWFLTCCQPSSEKDKPKHPNEKPDAPPLQSPRPSLQPPSKCSMPHETQPPVTPGPEGTGISSGVRTPVESEDGTGIEHHDTQPPSESSGELIPAPLQPVPSTPGLPAITKPYISSPSEPIAPTTPPKGDEVYVIMPDTHETEPLLGTEQPLLPSRSASDGVGMDIIKAIVYGGLLECITSLSVITSAAGGDSSTLNIVALGLANVFGGLVLLLHNLRVLQHEQATDRYVDQLGRPGHFLLHAIVAVLSYIIFGLMSPLIYGFAFRKSDNKDYKLATLATASLLCVAFLSIGKAYTRRPQLKVYFQTFFYYISMAFMVSGLGYVAGDLINMLLKKYGVFDSRTEPVAMREAWASY